MEIFVVSFLIFATVTLLLLLGQRLGGRQLPVGCTPETGECCLHGRSSDRKCCVGKPGP